jgi:hypothetical protein
MMMVGCVGTTLPQARMMSNVPRNLWVDDPLVGNSALQRASIPIEGQSVSEDPMSFLPQLFGVLPAHVSTAVVVHINVAVYAMAYWMNLSLLPFLTKGN